jgi:hypothetical protein
VCFVIRLAGVYFDLNVPQAPGRVRADRGRKDGAPA